jgi:hypothetical protein
VSDRGVLASGTPVAHDAVTATGLAQNRRIIVAKQGTGPLPDRALTAAQGSDTLRPRKNEQLFV